MTWNSRQWIVLILTILIGTAAGLAEDARPNGKFADLNGIRLYYESSGEGTALVLLHQFGNSGAVWDPFVPVLAKTYRVIVPDLRGHGRSTNPSERFTHKQAALDIYSLLDQLAVKRFAAMGASTGAMTLLHMATQQPGRIEALVLIGGSNQISQEARALMSAPDCESLSDDDWRRMRALHKHGDAQIEALQRQFCDFRKSYDDVNFTGSYLSTIEARTLLVHGDHDRFFPVRIAMEMYGAIPHAYLWTVPNGSHLPPFTPEHHEAFVQSAVRFLRGDWEKK